MKKSTIFLLVVLCSCSVGPNYKTPEDTISNAWASSPVDSDAIKTAWWEAFGDELLIKYIKLAAEYNNDLLAATSNIYQARAMRMIVASAFFPKIGADINATRTYFSKNGPVFAGSDILGVDSNPSTLPFNLQAPQLQSLFNAVLDAKWEIDVWGKTRRAVEAASAYIGQAIEERNDVLLSIMAEIANNYIELRGYQREGKLISDYIALIEEEYLLIHKQYDAGYVSYLDDENIRATLAKERAKLPEIEAQIRKNIYTLSILTGSVPETLLEELLIYKDLPKVPETIAVGLRSDLLKRRPDVRKVERKLAEATAEIGVAVASFFPSIVFMGDIGFQSLSLSNLFSMGSKTWSGGGDFNLPIFQGGKLVGNLKAKKAKTEIAAKSYQQTILNALQETESAVTVYTQDLKIISEKKEAKNRYQDLLFLTKARFTSGLVSALELIDAERVYNQAEQDLLGSDVKTLLDTIFLYKALGGGWENPPN